MSLTVLSSLLIIFVVANQEAIASINDNFGQNQASEFMIYTDNIYGFSIEYPSTWQYEKSNDYEETRGLSLYNVHFIPQSMRALVKVSIMDLPKTSLTSDAQKLLGFTDTMLGIYSKNPLNKIIGAGQTTMANLDATYITSLKSEEGMNLKFFEVLIVVDNILYTIEYGSTLEEFDIYTPIVTKMINSFQLGR